MCIRDHAMKFHNNSGIGLITEHFRNESPKGKRRRRSGFGNGPENSAEQHRECGELEWVDRFLAWRSAAESDGDFIHGDLGRAGKHGQFSCSFPVE